MLTSPGPDAPLFMTDDGAAAAMTGAAVTEAAAIASLRDDGLAILDLRDDVTLARIDQARADLGPLFADAVDRVQDAWVASPAARALAADQRITDFLRRAYGRRAFPFQTLHFARGSRQGVHSDVSHFHAAPRDFMCGVWLALEDVAEDAGPLVYYPGSHRLPPMTPRAMGITAEAPTAADYAAHNEAEVQRRIAAHGLSPRYGLLEKGQALVWAANLLHGGAGIRREGATRWSQVTHYFFDGCLYHTPMISGPMISEEGVSRRSIRLPVDIGTGRFVWPRRDGVRVMPNARVIADGIKRRLYPRPYRFRGPEVLR